MDWIFGILFELIVEGSIEALGEKKIPVAVRVAAALIVFIVLGGLAGMIIFFGIRDQNWIEAVLGVLLGAYFVFGIVRTVKKRRS